MESFFSFLVSNRVQTQLGLRLLIASVELIFLAVALQGFFRLFRVRSPRLRGLLWALVLFKPLITLMLESPFVLARFEIAPRIESPSVAGENLPAPASGSELRIRGGRSTPPVRAAVENPTRKPQPPSAWISIPLRRDRFLTGLSCLWVLGICLGTVTRSLAGYRLRSVCLCSVSGSTP